MLAAYTRVRYVHHACRRWLVLEDRLVVQPEPDLAADSWGSRWYPSPSVYIQARTTPNHAVLGHIHLLEVPCDLLELSSNVLPVDQCTVQPMRATSDNQNLGICAGENLASRPGHRQSAEISIYSYRQRIPRHDQYKHKVAGLDLSMRLFVPRASPGL